ncbi:type II secretion system F family protein [Opitutales bacterium ASA1]|uniref:type II secretion system F family protein n=1 Tax=Congregicoccus parvus TaxID=3081749 RepID=UPI002B2B5965|nr:type II secretion system F family protein [Opitutales bacterium ASA1]
MPRFTFSAVDSSGKERNGLVEAASVELASVQVKSMGLFPTAIAPEEVASPARSRRRKTAIATTAVRTKKPVVIGRVVSRKRLTVFTRQLATLVQAGLPLLRSLEVLGRQEKAPAFKWVIEQLAENIRSGNTLSEGLSSHPKVFDRLYVNMVRAGEAGGVLDVVLNRLARFMEKAERIKGRVRAAMIYPIVIMCVTVIILGVLMIYVVPKFEDIYRDQLRGAPLPVLTQIVLETANAIKNNLLSGIVLVVAAVLGFRLLKQSRVGARSLDWLALHVPLLGDLALKASIARFSRTLGTLLASGVPILQSLLITRDTSGNSIVVEGIDYVHDRVKEGESIAIPLEQTKVFPGMVTSMIDVGEETGELNEMLNRVADTYEEEVDNAVAGLTSIIEPIMIVFLAGVVGTIVVALFLPIKDLIQRLQ